MADTNMTPETNSAITQSSEVQNALLAKVAAIVETAKNHTHVCVLALTLAVAGAANAEEPIVLASSALGTSGDAQGEIIDSSLNSAQIESQIIIIEADSAQIQNQITIIETNVAELEAKDVLTGENKRDRYLLKKQLIELERSKTALSTEHVALSKAQTALSTEHVALSKAQTALSKAQTALLIKALMNDLGELKKELKEKTSPIK